MKKQKRSHRTRPLAIEHLERRDLLTDLYSGGMQFQYTGNPSTNERGGAFTLQARLVREPVADATISVTATSDTPAEGRVGAGNTLTLGWTAADWQTFKGITVTGVDDTVDDGMKPYKLTFGNLIVTATAGGTPPTDPYYTPSPTNPPKAPADIDMKNWDDDLKANPDAGVLINEDETGDIDVLANDTNWVQPGVQNRNFTFTNIAVTQGNVTASEVGGKIQVVPTENWSGDFKLTYSISGVSWDTVSTTTVTGKILPVNDKPIANDDTHTAKEDIGGFVNAKANDTDIESPNSDLKYDWVDATSAMGGTITIIGSGLMWYKGPPNYSGPDSFQYSIIDMNGAEGHIESEMATVNVTVTPWNDKPKANKGGAGIQTDEDTIAGMSFEDDDEDPDFSQTLTYNIVTPPTNGSVDFATMTYTPNPDYFGSDFFAYSITDDDSAGEPGPETSDIASVVILVNPINDAPWASGSSGSCDEDTSASIDLAGAYGDIDNDVSTLVITVDSPYASVSGGVVTYTPPANFNGEETFGFTVTDPAGLTASGSITVSVAPVNDAPTAVDDGIAWITPDISVTIPVLDNDFDIDGPEEVLSVISVDYTGSHGTVTFTSTSVTFTGNGDWTQGGV